MTNCCTKRIWVSDVIGEDYKTWKNEFILMGFGTGRGKTTFSLDVYCPWLISQGKTILYLCNRKKLRSQTKEVADRKSIKGKVVVESYQSIQKILNKGENLPQFDVIICDEAHYFLSDAEFNLYTDVSYNYITNQRQAVVLFMTATYKNVFGTIDNTIKNQCSNDNLDYRKPTTYMLPTDYSYVYKICWYQKKDDLYGIVDTILSGTEDKAIYFCNGIGKMQKFYNHYSPTYGTDEIEKYNDESKLKYMDFCCSDYTKNLWAKKHSNDKAIRQTEQGGFIFDNRILISTKCIDNGVDFKDRNIRHIICDIFDIESAIQCLGRKRILDDMDKCTFYIRDYQSYELNIFYKNVINELESANLFISDRKKWESKYGKDRSYKDKTVFYDFDITNDWQINELRHSKLLLDEALIKMMIDKKTSYRSEILKYLGASVSDKSVNVTEVQREKIKDIIEIFISNNIGKKLDKEKQEELVSICGIKDRFGRLQKSIGQISKYLEKNYGYELYSKVSKINNKSIRSWIIEKSKVTKSAKP